MKFSELGLSLEVEKAVEELGYTTPTPIQAQAIPQVLMGRDIFGIAQTGTGKTASFILPMIDILHGKRSRGRMPRSLVLEPTRELAAQVLANFEEYGKYHKLKAALLVGGESMNDQEKVLNKGVDVLIATPGRLLDLFDRGQILMADVKILVIDEADRMMDMGFIPDVNRIVAMLPKIRQTLLFSATTVDEIKRLSQAYLINPREIIVSPTITTAENIEQFVLHVDSKKKKEAVQAIIQEKAPDGSVIIFCNRKRDVSTLTTSLKKLGFVVEGMHGDMHQSKRTETLELFKSNKIKILVASDVAARGLDVADLKLVINYDIPFSPEDYIHRIGRTGRAGNSGIAVTLVSSTELKLLAAVENLIKKKIPDINFAIPAVQSAQPAQPPKPVARERARSAQPPKAVAKDKAAVVKDDVVEEKKSDEAVAEPAPRRSKPQGRPQKVGAGPDEKKQRGRRDELRPDSTPEPTGDVVGFGSTPPAFILRKIELPPS